MHDLEQKILSQKWFYKYNLPSGVETETYINSEVHKIHDTRVEMMFSVLDPLIKDWEKTTCIDLACHQGYFSYHLALKKCKEVLAIDMQEEHIFSTNLIKNIFNLTNVKLKQEDFGEMDMSQYEPADVVLMFGLLYNLEDPIRFLRRAKSLTKKVLLIETQTTMLELTGNVDSGSHLWSNEMQGIFGIFPGLPNVPDGSKTNIILYPSTKGLLWIMKRLGFSKVELVTPPENAYEQLLMGKRIMVACYV
jgi:hypothetical protein